MKPPPLFQRPYATRSPPHCPGRGPPPPGFTMAYPFFLSLVREMPFFHGGLGSPAPPFSFFFSRVSSSKRGPREPLVLFFRRDQFTIRYAKPSPLR